MVTQVLAVILMMTFFIQNLLLLGFQNRILTIRGGNKTIIILSIIAAYLNLSSITEWELTITTTFGVLTIMYLAQTLIFFKADKLSKFTFGLMMPLHLIAIIFIVTGTISFVAGISFYELHNTANKVLVIRTITAGLLSVFIVIISKIFGLKYFNILKKHKDRMKVFFILELMILLQLYGTSTIFSILQTHLNLVITVLLVGLGALGVFYMGIFMLVGFEILEDYRIFSHSKLMDNMYRTMLIEKSERTIEIDCKTGLVLNYVIKGDVKKNLIGSQYESLITDMVKDKIHPDDNDGFFEKHKLSYMCLLCAKEDIKHAYECEYRLLEDNGKYAWYKDYINVQRGNNDSVKAVMVTNNIQRHKNLEFNANMDGLSGLYNKTATTELITDYVDEHRSGILFMIDIDNFKGVNDNFGHDVGDEVIREIATKLSCVFKKGDILGRMGGDEFMAFVKAGDIINIEDKASQICEVIYTTYYNDAGTVTISSSIGICPVSEKVNNFTDLYKVADTALYESKSRGKNTYTIRQL